MGSPITGRGCYFRNPPFPTNPSQSTRWSARICLCPITSSHIGQWRIKMSLTARGQNLPSGNSSRGKRKNVSIACSACKTRKSKVSRRAISSNSIYTASSFLTLFYSAVVNSLANPASNKMSSVSSTKTAINGANCSSGDKYRRWKEIGTFSLD